MKLLLKNGRVVDPANGRDGEFDVLIEDGVIKRVGKNLPADGAEVMLLEMPIFDQPFERRPQFALSSNDESRVRYFSDDERRRFDEVPLSFVGNERGDVADDRGLMREKQLFVQVRSRR